MSEQEYRHIIRLGGRDIDGQENLLQGISQVKGVGIRLSNAILTTLKLDPMNRIGYLSDADIERIEKTIEDPVKAGLPAWYVNRQRDRMTGKMAHLTGPDLDFAHRSDIERLKRIKCWRGIRHSLGLKVRGQHTRTTGRTGMSVGVSRKRIKREAREAE
ncbi:MAG: 30S ribosomal protein S13 [Candidatus Thorarchaeota archaeon]|jgi:small subunit ribosomal protein S13